MARILYMQPGVRIPAAATIWRLPLSLHFEVLIIPKNVLVIRDRVRYSTLNGLLF
jgi:hypothetical protein